MITAMMNAFSNLFKKPATIQYPFEATPKAKDFRGLIMYEESKCTFCVQCEAVCPPGAILFDQNLENGQLKYFYNPYLCIYCKECVRACPEPGHDGALWQVEETIEPSTDQKSVNDAWFELEKSVAHNREAWKEIKKAKKAQEAAATTQESTHE